MEKRLTSHLYELNKYARTGIVPETSPDLEEILLQTATRQNQDTRWQTAVYIKQIDKQAVMRDLRDSLAEIDNGLEHEYFSQNSDIKVLVKDAKLFTENNQEITLGDLLTGEDWGLNYNLDPETVPRNIRKKYVIEKAKSELRELTNWQIYFDHAFSDNTHLDLKVAYYGAMKTEHPPLGIVLEKMVRTYMKKMAINHNLNYSIQESDIFQDVVQKIDFIIHLKEHRRGVRFEESHSSDEHNIGIQFTTNTNEDKISFKERQIERSRRQLSNTDEVDEVEDIVLAVLFVEESSQLSQAYLNWKKSNLQQTPDAYLPEAIKEYLFKKLLGDTGHMTNEEVDEEWGKILYKADQPDLLLTV